MAMIAEKKTSETYLEGRYEITVTSDLMTKEFRNVSAEESLQLNGRECNILSQIQTADSDEDFCQELEHENRNLIQNDEGEDDLNEGRNNTPEADVEGDEDYFFPSPEEMEKARPPVVGMVFPTLKDAQRFVNTYG